MAGLSEQSKNHLAPLVPRTWYQWKQLETATGEYAGSAVPLAVLPPGGAAFQVRDRDRNV